MMKKRLLCALLLLTLALSLLLVGLLMLPVVLFFASRMVRPITRMRTVALTMAGGDLTALPQRLQSLGADSLPHAGAKLI